MKPRFDRLAVAALSGCALVSGLACAEQNFVSDMRTGKSARIVTLPPTPGKLETYFINLKDDDIVRSPFRIIFGVTGLGIAPAGIMKNGTGHHHLLIDSTMPFDLSKPIPFSDKYMHFGGGQTEAVLDLPPGKHTLQLLFADGDHRPLYKMKSDTEVVIHSKKITIIVEDPAKVTQ